MELSRPIEILLVEDNEGDVFLTKKAFEKAEMQTNIRVAMDGEAAIDVLNNVEGNGDWVKPDIVLLDINLPKKDGKQVLAEIKSDDKLKRIPVVILSSSKAEQDVLKTYDLHANSYIIKPLSPEKFQEVISAIEGFWFNTAVLPKG